MGADGTRFLRSASLCGLVAGLLSPWDGRESVPWEGGLRQAQYGVSWWLRGFALADVQMLTDGRKSCVRLMCYGKRS